MGGEDRQPISGVVEHLFRHESARIVAALTRILGVHNLDLAEEIVQQTLVKALQVWPYHALPRNPAAWLMQAAKNLAIDRIRHDRHRRRFAAEYQALLDSEWTLAATVHDSFLERELEDDQLRMIFTCCHPELPQESQVALTLRLCCGLTAPEIATAFLGSAAGVQKRLFRAKQKLRALQAPFEVPAGNELLDRLDVVLAALYLTFNEGYHSVHHDRPVRRELCREALRLALLLAGHERLGAPEVDALVALFCFHAARIPARIVEDGAIRLLEEQDRSLWDGALIRRGTEYLERASRGEELSRYHLEAAIAACHCRAASFDETDWVRILELYDLLAERQPSPVVRMNRAIALGFARGAETAVAELEALRGEPALRGYGLLPATLGEFYRRLGRDDRARACFREAIEATPSEAERRLLRQKAGD